MKEALRELSAARSIGPALFWFALRDELRASSPITYDWEDGTGRLTRLAKRSRASYDREGKGDWSRSVHHCGQGIPCGCARHLNRACSILTQVRSRRQRTIPKRSAAAPWPN